MTLYLASSVMLGSASVALSRRDRSCLGKSIKVLLVTIE